MGVEGGWSWVGRAQTGDVCCSVVCWGRISGFRPRDLTDRTQVRTAAACCPQLPPSLCVGRPCATSATVSCARPRGPQRSTWRSSVAASLLRTRERYPSTSRSQRPSVPHPSPMLSRFCQAHTRAHKHMQHAHTHAHIHTRLVMRCRLAHRTPGPLQGLVPEGPADCPRQDRRRSGGGAP